LGTHTPAEAQAIFTLSVAAGSMSSAGFATATQDLADKYIGMYVREGGREGRLLSST
jgi:hypothetical protein